MKILKPALLVVIALLLPKPVTGESAPAAVQVAFVGDSMADGLWGAMFRRVGKDKCLSDKIKLIRKAKNGTGLTRLDVFNWVDEVGNIANSTSADVMVGSIGINDRQNIVEPDRKAHTTFGTEEYNQRYLQLVEQFIGQAANRGASVVLVGLPVMLDPDANTDAQAKNKIFMTAVESAKSPTVTYAHPWASQPGTDIFKPYIEDAHKSMVQIRVGDGVHFTSVGYDMVIDSIFPSIMESIKQRGRDLAAECSGQSAAK